MHQSQWTMIKNTNNTVWTGSCLHRHNHLETLDICFMYNFIKLFKKKALHRLPATAKKKYSPSKNWQPKTTCLVMEAEPFTPLGSAIKQLPSSKGKHAEANEKKEH